MKRRLQAFARAGFHFAKFLFLLFLLLALVIAAVDEWLVDPAEGSLPIFSVFALMFLIGLLEVGGQRLLPQYYFRIGIPLMWQNYEIDFAQGLPTDFERISGTVASVGLLPQVEIKQLTESEYGLWANAMVSKGGWLRRRKTGYNPLTRGYICLDKGKMRLKMRAYLNWSVIPFMLIWFGIALFGPGLILSIVFVVIGSVIFVQLYRGEVQQYLKVWDVVKRYSYGEYGVDEIAVRLRKANREFT